MAVMNIQKDGKQVLRFCSEFVQEWGASVSAYNITYKCINVCATCRMYLFVLSAFYTMFISLLKIFSDLFAL